MNRYPLLMLALGMFSALTAAVLIVTLNLNPPPDDIRLLVMFMTATGGVTVIVAYLIYRLGRARWFPSLRWLLLIIVVITVLLVLLNVWVTAHLMFISEHDLILTAALLLFAGVTAVMFGIVVAGTFSTRIIDLSDAARHIAAGQLETRLTIKGSDELTEFARTFNWMADNLEKLDQQKRMVEQTRRDLIAWVSHDLRTPMTSIRAMLEAIIDEIVTDQESQRRYIGRALGEVNHLDHLINDLFELAKLDTGHIEGRFVRASLRDLISDVISTMNARAIAAKISLEGIIEENIDPVYLVPDKIQRAITNLIDNALRYTLTGGAITIRAYCVSPDCIRVDVHNTGSYIEPEDLPHIFTSFFRVERARPRAEDGRRGTGLGLAIARGFVEMHRGRLWAESVPGKGTTFCMELPRQQPMTAA